MLRKSTNLDLCFLSVFTVLITFQPYFLYGKVNLFEFGIYLPNINAILDGLIPYKDFFHLRGPLELYVPALCMRLFGENLAVLEAYFYVGTVITLIIAVFIAKELFNTRIVLYLFVPILIGRTFPRAVFNNWGGMRYGLGLLAVLFVIYFFKRKKLSMLFISGIISGLAFLTSIEIGVATAVSIVMTFLTVFFINLVDRSKVLKAVVVFITGFICILLPYFLYLWTTGSLEAYINMTYSVVTNMTNVFPDHLFEDHPRNLWDAIMGLNPFNRHFEHLTPAYCYLFFVLFMIFQKRKGVIDIIHPGIITVAWYGFIMFVSAFRKLGAAQFEMALQPEKILLFFMLEYVLFFLLTQLDYLKTVKQKSKTTQAKVFGIYFLVFAFFMSSLGYSVARFNHRFFAYKYVRAKITGKDAKILVPLRDQETEVLTIKRLAGLNVPMWQAVEFKQLIQFFDEHTEPNEPVFMFPEQGAYNFILDRPFVGRFPMVSFSWIGESWHRELVRDLKEANPQFVIMPKVPDATLEKVYFKIPKNKENYNEILDYIRQHYQLDHSTRSLLIYQLKGT